jgi:hypothetical protein
MVAIAGTVLDHRVQRRFSASHSDYRYSGWGTCKVGLRSRTSALDSRDTHDGDVCLGGRFWSFQNVTSNAKTALDAKAHRTNRKYSLTKPTRMKTSRPQLAVWSPSPQSRAVQWPLPNAYIRLATVYTAQFTRHLCTYSSAAVVGDFTLGLGQAQ